MAEFLYRIGRNAAGHGWRVIAVWAVIFAVAGGGFALGFGTLANNFDIPGTASSEVIERLEGELPEYSGASGMVVIHTEDGAAFTDEQRTAYAGLIERAGQELPDVAGVVDPFAAEAQRAAQAAEVEGGKAQLEQQVARFGGASPELEQQGAQLEAASRMLDLADGIRLVSADGSVAVINVGFSTPRMELSDETRNGVIDFFDGNRVDGVAVDYSTDIAQGVPEVFGVAEIIGLVIAGTVLLVMLGTVVAAALPIVTAVVGVGIGVLASLGFSSVVQMASITPVLGVMLGLAVGIDYSLFIVNRHRRQLAHGMSVRESVALANGTAGNAVLFAGSTVIVALLALNITGVSFLGIMGTVGAVCVAVAVFVAVTLTPAILGLVGERVLGERARARLAATPSSGSDAKPMRTPRAVLTIVASVLALLVIAIPALSMRLGLPDGSSEPAGSTTNQAYELTADAFGAGTNATLLVTADLPAGLDEAGRAGAQLEISQAIDEVGGVEAIAPIAVSDSGELAAFRVVPVDGPNSESTEQLVRDLRGDGVLDGTSYAGVALGVAGQAAINIDISGNLADVLPVYLLVVVGLSLLIMIVVFRSILVPLVATGGFVLSLFATYGATVAVFQWGWLGSVFGVTTTGPILSFLPVILVGILFGLAMDYQLFLATGMREAYVHGSAPKLAVAQGFRAGRAVVTAAALIMVSVFGGFVFSDSNIIRSVGFGLAVGVLIDAFVIRMLLMPALMHLLGRSAWWLPRWLDRVLPNVDVEGAALERRHP
ncbi:RND transporter [Actinophytocola xinjiangensis]|uniref:RND transporter n=1 Tax=Actinophytocola xinjiangensis TaxID=485602 RepID=A0A7Z0WQ23_9PSEU|nr:MMPL family transporter [Actinophytocola xinjiangensis]OLF11999.1 RND transporter [Actinophytocola xinjiangensis]